MGCDWEGLAQRAFRLVPRSRMPAAAFSRARLESIRIPVVRFGRPVGVDTGSVPRRRGEGVGLEISRGIGES